MTFFSPLVRLLVEMFKNGNFSDTFLYVFPDAGFFFGHALLFSYVTKKLGYAPYHKFYIRLIICDFGGNTLEQTLRVMSGLTVYSLDSFKTFAVIALFRSFIVILICIAFDTYMSLLKRTEHEENYKKLILMASTFEAEVYSMKKNMNEIEDIMANAFSLYRNLDSEEYPPELKDTALNIAKDIHEIKKGYRRVIKGLQDNFLSDLGDDSALPLSDLLKIFATDVDKSRVEHGLNISFHSSYETNHLIQKYFAFMSIIGNFISNSIDAFEEMPKPHHGEIYVRCRDMRKDGITYCAVEYKDNGPGIPQDEIEYIFVPGYSTKFDESTGDINRGLGLTLSKDLMETQFDGHIEVIPSNRGANFLLWFPVSSLTEKVNSYANPVKEVETDEILYTR